MKPQRQDSTADQLDTVALVAADKGLVALSEWVTDWEDWTRKISYGDLVKLNTLAIEEGCRDAADAMKLRHVSQVERMAAG